MNAKELRVERLKVLREIDKLSDQCECDTHGVRNEDCKNCKALEKLGTKLSKLVGKRKVVEGDETSTKPHLKWNDELIQKLRKDGEIYTYEQVAEKWEVSEDAIRQRCRQFRVKCQLNNKYPVYELYKGGILIAVGGISGIAKETGIGRGKIEYCRSKRTHEDMEMKRIG
ncbi:hypothetical protein [Solibacillus cecembensis]|uniref:hypothetical protein n=1 Tax=Solibacillus cecembensis TaxID=459347 RepID=UPI003D067F1A